MKSFFINSFIANALPGAESIENVLTNFPRLVNSTISLVPAVVFVTVDGSALAVIKWPLVASISPRGPRRCVESEKSTVPVPRSVVVWPAPSNSKISLSSSEAT